jgi:3-hydroxyisobutyrate dehydrogenase
MNMKDNRLGWIGLGRMGYPMTERLARAGCDIAAYNRTRSKAEPLGALGVRLVDKPGDLADCDIVFTMVSTAADLKQVTVAIDGVLATPGKAPGVLVDLSTVSAEASTELRAAAAKRGTQMLVVPVSGNDQVARAGKLSVLASGPKEAFDVVAPYLACFGPSVNYIGEGDSAREVKIAHNMFLGIVFQALSECTILAEKRGVPRHVFLEVMNRSVLGSTFTRYKSPGLVNLDFTVTFTNALLRKDLDLGLEAAAQTGAELPLTHLVRSLVQKCIDDGGAEEDYTTLFLRQAAASGLVPRREDVAVHDGLS